MTDFDDRPDATQQADASLELGHRICARYGNSPGMALLPGAPAVVTRSGRFTAERLPLLASLQQRWSNSVLLPRGWKDPIYAWPVFASARARRAVLKAGAPERPAPSATLSAVPIQSESAEALRDPSQSLALTQTENAAFESPAATVPAMPPAPPVSPTPAPGPAQLGRPVFRRQVRETLPTRPRSNSPAIPAASIQRKAGSAIPASESPRVVAADTGRYDHDEPNAAREGHGLGTRAASPDLVVEPHPDAGSEAGAPQQDPALSPPSRAGQVVPPSVRSEIGASSARAKRAKEVDVIVSVPVSPQVLKTPENAGAASVSVQLATPDAQGTETPTPGIHAEVASADPVPRANTDDVGLKQPAAHRIVASALLSPRNPDTAPKHFGPAETAQLRTTAGPAGQSQMPIQADADVHTERPAEHRLEGAPAGMVQLPAATPAGKAQMPIEAEQASGHRIAAPTIISAEHPAPGGMVQLRTAAAPASEAQVPIQANVDINRPQPVISAEHSAHGGMVQLRTSAAPASEAQASIQVNVDTNRPKPLAEHRLAAKSLPSAEHTTAREGKVQARVHPPIANVDTNRPERPGEHLGAAASLSSAGHTAATVANAQAPVHPVTANAETNRAEQPADDRLAPASLSSAGYTAPPVAKAQAPIHPAIANEDTNRPEQPAERRLAASAIVSSEHSAPAEIVQLRTVAASPVRVQLNRVEQPAGHRVEDPALLSPENRTPAAKVPPSIRAHMDTDRPEQTTEHRLGSAAPLSSELLETTFWHSNHVGTVELDAEIPTRHVVAAPILAPTQPDADPGSVGTVPSVPSEVVTHRDSVENVARPRSGSGIVQRKAAGSGIATPERSISQRHGEAANETQVHLSSPGRGSKEGPFVSSGMVQLAARSLESDASRGMYAPVANSEVQAREPVPNQVGHDRGTHAPAASPAHHLSETGLAGTPILPLRASAHSVSSGLAESSARQFVDAQVLQPSFDHALDHTPQPGAAEEAAAVTAAEASVPHSDAGSAMQHFEHFEPSRLVTSAEAAPTHGASHDPLMQEPGAISQDLPSSLAGAVAHRDMEPLPMVQRQQHANQSMQPRGPASTHEVGSPAQIEGRAAHTRPGGISFTSRPVPNTVNVIQRQPALDSSPSQTPAQPAQASPASETVRIEHRSPNQSGTIAAPFPRVPFSQVIAHAVDSNSPPRLSVPARAEAGLPPPAVVHGPQHIQRSADVIGGPSFHGTSGGGRFVNRMTASARPQAGNVSAAAPPHGAGEPILHRSAPSTPDINGVADQVYQMLVRRLASERLRKGI